MRFSKSRLLNSIWKTPFAPPAFPPTGLLLPTLTFWSSPSISEQGGHHKSQHSWIIFVIQSDFEQWNWKKTTTNYVFQMFLTTVHILFHEVNDNKGPPGPSRARPKFTLGHALKNVFLSCTRAKMCIYFLPQSTVRLPGLDFSTPPDCGRFICRRLLITVSITLIQKGGATQETPHKLTWQSNTKLPFLKVVTAHIWSAMTQPGPSQSKPLLKK